MPQNLDLASRLGINVLQGHQDDVRLLQVLVKMPYKVTYINTLLGTI